MTQKICICKMNLRDLNKLGARYFFIQNVNELTFLAILVYFTMEVNIIAVKNGRHISKIT